MRGTGPCCTVSLLALADGVVFSARSWVVADDRRSRAATLAWILASGRFLPSRHHRLLLISTAQLCRKRHRHAHPGEGETHNTPAAGTQEPPAATAFRHAGTGRLCDLIEHTGRPLQAQRLEVLPHRRCRLRRHRRGHSGGARRRVPGVLVWTAGAVGTWLRICSKAERGVVRLLLDGLGWAWLTRRFSAGAAGGAGVKWRNSFLAVAGSPRADQLPHAFARSSSETAGWVSPAASTSAMAHHAGNADRWLGANARSGLEGPPVAGDKRSCRRTGISPRAVRPAPTVLPRDQATATVGAGDCLGTGSDLPIRRLPGRHQRSAAAGVVDDGLFRAGRIHLERVEHGGDAQVCDVPPGALAKRRALVDAAARSYFDELLARWCESSLRSAGRACQDVGRRRRLGGGQRRTWTTAIWPELENDAAISIRGVAAELAGRLKPRLAHYAGVSLQNTRRAAFGPTVPGIQPPTPIADSV